VRDRSAALWTRVVREQAALSRFLPGGCHNASSYRADGGESRPRLPPRSGRSFWRSAALFGLGLTAGAAVLLVSGVTIGGGVAIPPAVRAAGVDKVCAFKRSTAVPAGACWRARRGSSGECAILVWGRDGPGGPAFPWVQERSPSQEGSRQHCVAVEQLPIFAQRARSHGAEENRGRVSCRGRNPFPLFRHHVPQGFSVRKS